jgi:hypothetical protein
MTPGAQTRQRRTTRFFRIVIWPRGTALDLVRRQAELVEAPDITKSQASSRMSA